MTTPRDSFNLFAWNYRGPANSLLTLCGRSEGGFVDSLASDFNKPREKALNS